MRAVLDLLFVSFAKDHEREPRPTDIPNICTVVKRQASRILYVMAQTELSAYLAGQPHRVEVGLER
jgi:hypothetical protein